jgi:phosphoserine phosphatase
MERFAVFPGPSMRQPELVPVLIFDLDGTILRINSFPRWVLYMLFGRIPKLHTHIRGRLALHVLLLLLRRKFGRLDHEELQQLLATAWQRANGAGGQGIADRLNAKLLRQRRRNLRLLLNLVANRQLDAVLATAAAAAYAEQLGRSLGFSHVLTGGSGDRKRQQVLSLLRDTGWHDRSLILFTDHEDDLPLMRECSAVCWFGSTHKLPAVRTAAVGVRFISCKDMSERTLTGMVHELLDEGHTSAISTRLALSHETIVS